MMNSLKKKYKFLIIFNFVFNRDTNLDFDSDPECRLVFPIFRGIL